MKSKILALLILSTLSTAVMAEERKVTTTETSTTACPATDQMPQASAPATSDRPSDTSRGKKMKDKNKREQGAPKNEEQNYPLMGIWG